MTDLIENDHYLKIKKLFDGKKFDEIITYCQKLLEKNTDDKLALQNIATAYNMVGAYQDAILCSEKVLGMDSNDEFALKNKIFASEKLEMHDQVLICCNKILKNNCDNIDVLIAKGIAFNKTEKHEDAISAYKKVLTTDKNNLDALMNLAITYNHLQMYNDAITYYDMIQEITPKFSNIPIEKSKAFEALGKNDDAFLAAQGIRLDEAENIKNDAKIKKYSVQHAFELKRFHASSKVKHDDRN